MNGFEEGVASVIPEDGITQVDIDILNQQIDSANIVILDLNINLEIALNDITDLQGQLEEALSNQEDGVTQVDIDLLGQQVDSANFVISGLNTSLGLCLSDLTAANILIQELQNQVTQLEGNQIVPIHIDLVSGWNMIGFSCNQQITSDEAFINILDNLIIVKANNGNVYLPEFNFNGIGYLIPGYGYQIKVTEYILDFNICE